MAELDDAGGGVVGGVAQADGPAADVAAAVLLELAAGSDQVTATQQQLAAELGTAREVVFRALRVLVGRGLIATGRGRVRVLDRAGLVAAARVLS